MNRILLAILSIALALPIGCSTSGSGTTAPSNNPEKPTATRKLTVKAPREKTIKQNGTVDADISVSRDNFTGPVEIEFHKLPAGVTVVTQDLTIPEGKDSVKVTLRAAADAKILESQMVEVTAKAKGQKDLKEDKVDFKLDVKAKDS